MYLFILFSVNDNSVLSGAPPRPLLSSSQSDSSSQTCCCYAGSAGGAALQSDLQSRSDLHNTAGADPTLL